MDLVLIFDGVHCEKKLVKRGICHDDVRKSIRPSHLWISVQDTEIIFAPYDKAMFVSSILASNFAVLNLKVHLKRVH